MRRWLLRAFVTASLVACAPTADELDASDGASDARRSDASAEATTPGDAAAPFADASLREDAPSPADASPLDSALTMEDVVTRDASDAMVPPSAPALYPANRAHSPITAFVQANLRAIAARGAGAADVFSKVGDSQTVYESGFMVCFAGTSVNLGGRTTLQPTIDHFRAGRVAGVTPYERRSLSAVVGWSASAPITGSPAPLDQELDAARPRFDVVMYGSNDSQVRDLPRYGENLWEIAERSLSRGVIPLFTSAPPRGDSAVADQWIPWYAHVARAVAQARQVPFIDLERALRAVPGFGLAGDNLHLSRSPRGGCQFNADDLRYGQNQRNLLTIESLDRARRALAAGANAPDTAATVAPASATLSDPIVIPSLPFSDTRDTARFGAATNARYSCSTANEGGREVAYRLDLAAPATVRAMVLDRGATDVDLHRLTAPNALSCAARDDRQLVAALPAGTHYFVVDSFVAADGRPREGEYIFVVFRE